MNAYFIWYNYPQSHLNSLLQNGVTPLHFAATRTVCAEVAELLIGSGADLNARDKVNITTFIPTSDTSPSCTSCDDCPMFLMLQISDKCYYVLMYYCF